MFNPSSCSSLPPTAYLCVGLSSSKVLRENLDWRPVGVVSEPLGVDPELTLGDHRELLAWHQALHPRVGRGGGHYQLKIGCPFNRKRVANLLIEPLTRNRVFQQHIG